MYPFQKTEFQLRTAVALGAYYKAKKANPKMDHHGLLKIARDANYRVNFNYGMENRPQLLRQLPRVTAQFKTFQFNQWQFLTNMKGMENARFWGAYLALAGILGIPGAMGLTKMIEDQTGMDMELETKKYLYDWAGDDPAKQKIVVATLYGGAGLFGGVDVSRRVSPGPDNILPSRIDPIPEVLGPGLGGGYNALGKFKEGEWEEGFRQIATSPANVYRAIKGDPRPSYDRHRKQSKLTDYDRLVMSLGFGPIRQRVDTDIKRITHYDRARLANKRSELITDYLDEWEADDKDAMKDVWQDIMDEIIIDEEGEKYLKGNAITTRRAKRMKSVLRGFTTEMFKRKMTSRDRALFFGVARDDITKYKNIYKFKP